MPPTEDVFVEMADGVRLAATLFLPDGDGPWPALLEALPYRKDDLTGTDGYREEYERLPRSSGTRCAGSTSAAPGPRRGSRSTSTPPRSTRTSPR